MANSVAGSMLSDLYGDLTNRSEDELLQLVKTIEYQNKAKVQLIAAQEAHIEATIAESRRLRLNTEEIKKDTFRVEREVMALNQDLVTKRRNVASLKKTCGYLEELKGTHKRELLEKKLLREQNKKQWDSIVAENRAKVADYKEQWLAMPWNVERRRKEESVAALERRKAELETEIKRKKQMLAEAGPDDKSGKAFFIELAKGFVKNKNLAQQLAQEEAKMEKLNTKLEKAEERARRKKNEQLLCSQMSLQPTQMDLDSQLLTMPTQLRESSPNAVATASTAAANCNFGETTTSLAERDAVENGVGTRSEVTAGISRAEALVPCGNSGLNLHSSTIHLENQRAGNVGQFGRQDPTCAGVSNDQTRQSVQFNVQASSCISPLSDEESQLKEQAFQKSFLRPKPLRSRDPATFARPTPLRPPNLCHQFEDSASFGGNIAGFSDGFARPLPPPPPNPQPHPTATSYSVAANQPPPTSPMDVANCPGKQQLLNTNINQRNVGQSASTNFNPLGRPSSSLLPPIQHCQPEIQQQQMLETLGTSVTGSPFHTPQPMDVLSTPADGGLLATAVSSGTSGGGMFDFNAGAMGSVGADNVSNATDGGFGFAFGNDGDDNNADQIADSSSVTGGFGMFGQLTTGNNSPATGGGPGAPGGGGRDGSGVGDDAGGFAGMFGSGGGMMSPQNVDGNNDGGGGWFGGGFGRGPGSDDGNDGNGGMFGFGF